MPAKFKHSISTDNLPDNVFIALAIEAAKSLSWNIGHRTETGFNAFTKLSLSSYGEEIKVSIDHGIADLKSECTGNQLVDWGKNRKNINQLIAAIDHLKNTYSPEELLEKTKEQQAATVPEEEALIQEPTSNKENISGYFSLFKPIKGYFITPLLVNINILVFILMVISGVNFFLPDSESMIRWGANFRPVTLAGEFWRLITCCFLHIGIFHLLMNMYALIYIGVLLEPHLGRTRFLACYLLSGLTASIASLWWHDFTISAGASGAIFGLYGVFLAMLTTDLIEKSSRKALMLSVGIFVGYNIINGFKPNSGIDNAAHLGGLLGGLIIGYAIIPGLKKRVENKLKYATVGLLSIVILVFSFIVYKILPNDIAVYEKEMKRFVNMETMAMQVFSMPENTSNAALMKELQDRGIYFWNENLRLVESCEKMDLPAKIQRRNKLLKEYCVLRIKSYELLYKSIAENSRAYDEELNNYSVQIENKIQEIQHSDK
jgi:rhomboid protease GluP